MMMIAGVVKAGADPFNDWAGLKAIADKLEPQARAAFVSAFEQVRKKVDVVKIAEGIKAGKVNQALLGIPKSMAEELADAIDVLNAGFAKGGAFAAAPLANVAAIDYRFDLVNPYAVKQAQKIAGALITNIGEDTRAAVRAVIVRAVKDGGHPYEIAGQIQEMVGLLPAHANAVYNLFNGLIVGGMSIDRADAQAKAYARRLHKYRARMIARTEVLGALNNGQRALWMQARRDGLIPKNQIRKWIITPDELLCAYCQQMAGKTAAVNKPFSTPMGNRMNPPMHPHCRCTHGLVIDIPGLKARGDAIRAHADIKPGNVPAPAVAQRPVPPIVVGVPSLPPVAVPVPAPLPPAPAVSAPMASDVLLTTAGDPGAHEMLTSEFVSAKNLGGGINQTFIAEFERPDGSTFKGVFKPESGEQLVGTRDSITNAKFTLAQREVLSRQIDRALGTNMVPDTVYRTINGERGSLQRFVEGAEPQMYYRGGKKMSIDDRWRMSVLDMAIGNTDRHAGNYMRVVKSGKAIAIDHGYTFPEAASFDPLGFGRELRIGPIDALKKEQFGYLDRDYRIPLALKQSLLTKIDETNWEAIIGKFDTMSLAERDAFLGRIKWLRNRIERDDWFDAFDGYTGFGWDHPDRPGKM